MTSRHAHRPTSAVLRGALAALVLLFAAVGAAATPRALLVGVSELVNQPTATWLQAPRNDVLLMRQVLAQRGFASTDVIVLADGVPGAGAPDAQRIREALAQLLAQSREGDFVLLYFSGHGTRVRDRAKAYQEPDGLAENFLARDARLAAAPGSGSGTPLAGNLRDVDFDGWIRAFLAQGVFVWSVFDSCSAASMTRGVARGAAAAATEAGADEEDPVRFRGVQADALSAAGDAGAARVDMAAPAAPAVPRARYVAFFASESHQVTPELKLPRHDRTARAQGLLTWSVAQSLARQPATFRELFNGVVQHYGPVIDELSARFPQRELPSPVAEGNLDAPLFANAPGPQSTRPAWPARRSGTQLLLDVGLLDGLEPGQPMRVVASAGDGSLRSAAAAIAEVQGGSARVAVPPELADADGATLWSLSPQTDPPSVQLRVQGAAALPAGITLAYPASVRVLAGGGDADVRLAPQGPGAVALQVLSPELQALLPSGAFAAPAASDAAALRQQLESLAQLKWLARLAQLSTQAEPLEGFEAQVEVWSGPRQLRVLDARQAAEQGVAPLADGERAVLAVRNASGLSLDLVVLGLRQDGAIVPVYPGAAPLAETNRFERGTRESPAAQRFELPWLAAGSTARLLVLAAPAAPLSPPRLFGAAALPAPGPEIRLRGALQALPRQRQAYGALVAVGGAAR